MQLALKAELKVSPDYELIDGRWPSIVEKQYMPFVSHAALKGYNDVMWAEIEHRHGKEARQRVENVRVKLNRHCETKNKADQWVADGAANRAVWQRQVFRASPLNPVVLH